MAWLAVGLLTVGLFLAVVTRRAHGAGPGSLLPNLVADPPDNASLETSQTEGGLSNVAGEPRLLLRFNGYVHNVGPGALDFRGSREAPKVSPQTEEEVERGRETETQLPAKTEEELASPPMQVFQRLFTTNAEETNIERPHIDEPSGAQMIYVNADGHHHWHLQRVARYSLWNAQKTAEVAPAQKVGFCMEDSQHVEPGVGPPSPVYSDGVPPFRDFCQRYRPNATSLYEGISPGWRDVYNSDLAFQWVDVSDVLPGEYWLREDVNPTGVIQETGGANTPAYAEQPTIIPGFDANALAAGVQESKPMTLTLTSTAWNDGATPRYTVVSAPTHGALTAVNGNQVTYTPVRGYLGQDSFTFSAADPTSAFPVHPAVATVAIEVTPDATVAISGAPPSMTAGTRVRLRAVVRNDSSKVKWSASAGSITSAGLYTAPPEPPAAGKAVVSARSIKGARGQRAITILGVSRPTAILIGRRLIMTTRVTKAGRVRLSAYLGRRRLGTCVNESRANRTFGCGLTLARSVSLHARIGVWATLQFGRHTLQSVRRPAPVASAKRRSPGRSTAAARLPSGAAAGVVAIAGAPSSMIAGTSVQLSAVVRNDGQAVTWNASAGSITSGGLYTAPSARRPRSIVRIIARGKRGAYDQRELTILPVPSGEAAPAVPLAVGEPPSVAGTGGSSAHAQPSGLPGLSSPQAMLVGRELIVTTNATAAGRLRLSAYRDGHRLGSCATQTPAERISSCRIVLRGRVALDAPISALASMRSGRRILLARRRAAPVAQMQMTGPNEPLAGAARSSAWQFVCSPSLRPPLASAG